MSSKINAIDNFLKNLNSRYKMLKKYLLLWTILFLFCNATVFSEVVQDTLTITVTTPEGNIIVPVSVLPQSINWGEMTIKGTYSGSPAHDKTEEIPCSLPRGNSNYTTTNYPPKLADKFYFLTNLFFKIYFTINL
ncbi:MAG: hypothetical protein LBE18_02965 [Planctomycetaceae bacterium]|jgi:hypothetical protein|nr:hypothetical protein [Planctomycetaceae bacterium]